MNATFLIPQLRDAIRFAKLLGVLCIIPLASVQQGYAQVGGNSGINVDPGTGTEDPDPDQDKEDEKSDEESEAGDSTEENGTTTDEDGEETTPGQNRESGPGNTTNPFTSEDPDKCKAPNPSPTPYDPDPDPGYDPFYVPEEKTDPTPETDPTTECFTMTFDLFGPGALSRGNVRFFTHEFANPGRIALRANVPSTFTVNKTTLPHPDDANFVYDRINSIDAIAMKIEFAAAPAALLALDPNAFTATEKNAANQQTRKTTISFVEEAGINYFRMDVDEFGNITRHEQTNPELNKLVLESGHHSGNVFAPLRRITVIKNFDGANLRKERITVEERASVADAYQLVSDREVWREAFMKHVSDLKIPGLGVGVASGGGGSGSGGVGGPRRPPITFPSPKAWVQDSVGKFYPRHTPFHYWRVIREIINGPTGTQPLVNTWGYYRSSDRSEPGFTRYSIGRIKRYSMHDGRRGSFTYALNRDTAITPYAGDPEGMLTVAEFDPGTRIRTVTSTVAGQTLSRVQTVYSGSTFHRARYTSTNERIVTHFFFVPDNQLFGGLPTRIQAADGTLTTYAYTRTSVGGIKTVMEQGAADNDFTVSEGLRTISISNSRGRIIYRETQAIDHGSANGKTYHRMAVTAVDTRGRPTNTAWHPETTSNTATAAAIGEVIAANNPAWQTSTIQFCCGPTSTTDRYGIKTYYAYDGLKRLIKTNRLTVTTETVRNGLTTDTHRYPETVSGSLSSALTGAATTLVSRSVSNLIRTSSESWTPDPTSAVAGAIIKSVSTATTYQPATGLSRRTVTTTPDSFSQTTDTFLDGRTATTYGDLSPAMQNVYSVNTTGEVSARSYNDDGTLRETVTTTSDWAGRTVRMDYMDGAFATMEYNTLGQMVKSTDPENITTIMEYNDRGERIITATDLNNNGTTDYGTDVVQFSETIPATGTINGVTGPVWQTTAKVWKDGGSSSTVSTSLRSPNGLTSSSQSLGVANPSVSVTSLLGGGAWTITNTAPDSTKQVQTYTAGLLASSSSLNDSSSVIENSTFAYDVLNRLLSSTDSRTGTTWLTPLYDDDNDENTPMVRHPSADVTAGDLTRYIEDPGGRTTILTYDTRGRRLTVDAPDTAIDGGNSDNITTISYNPNSTVLEVSGGQTYRTTHTYDYANRMVTLTTYRSAADSSLTTWSYSPTRGFLTAKRDAADKGADYTYTPAGRIATRTWARGLLTTYGYDHGRLTDVKYWNSAPLLGSYTQADNDATAIENDPSSTQQQKDTARATAAAAFLAARNPVTPNVSTQYDTLNRPVETSNGLAKTAYTYDAITLRLDTETISYEIEENGTYELVRVIDRSQDNLMRPAGFELEGSIVETQATYGYDIAGRLLTVADANSTFTYGYLANTYNFLETVTTTLANQPDHTVTNTYESTRNILTTKKNEVGTTTVSQYDYGVNDIGQRDSLATVGAAYDGPAFSLVTATGPAYDWSYNVRGELVEANDSSTANNDRAYEYDEIGNRKKTAEGLIGDLSGGDTYDVDALNQYIAVNTFTPTYDIDGNQIDAQVQPLGASSLASCVYAWDGENRLISATVNSLTTSHRYDSGSRRIATITPAAAVTLVIYDGWNPIASYQGNVGTTPTLSKTNLWGMDLSGTMQGAGGVGGLLSVKDSSGTHYPTFDGNGNVSEYLSSTGTVVAHYEYDPFGRTTVATGTKVQDFSHRFSTKPVDAETGLYYYGYRYYDPVTGRWPSRDPIAERGGVNLYGFCLNQPTNGVDVKGEIFWVPFIIVTLWLIEDANAPSPSDPPRPPRTDFLPPTPLDIVVAIVEEETGYEVPPFIPTKGNIKKCCGAIFKGENGLKRLGRLLGWDDATKRKASKNLHGAKPKTGRRPNDNVEFCSETGDILDPNTGESIGNLFD